MKKLTLLKLAAVSGIVLLTMAGCIYTDAVFPSYNLKQVNNEPLGSKEGEGCVTTYVGLVQVGDASVATAAKNGNISRISTVDTREFSILKTIYSKTCTVVHGE